MKLCPECGKREIKETWTICRACQMREAREYFRNKGICPECRKNELFGEEKTCIECRAKNAECHAKKREENLEKYRKRDVEYNRIRKERLRGSGLCVRCGKRKPEEGLLRCKICLHKGAEYSKMRRLWKNEVKV